MFMYGAVFARAFGFLLAFSHKYEINLSKVSLQSNLITESFSFSQLHMHEFSILILPFCVSLTRR